jgi:hypothetical protein
MCWCLKFTFNCFMAMTFLWLLVLLTVNRLDCFYCRYFQLLIALTALPWLSIFSTNNCFDCRYFLLINALIAGIHAYTALWLQIFQPFTLHTTKKEHKNNPVISKIEPQSFLLSSRQKTPKGETKNEKVEEHKKWRTFSHLNFLLFFDQARRFFG